MQLRASLTLLREKVGVATLTGKLEKIEEREMASSARHYWPC